MVNDSWIGYKYYLPLLYRQYRPFTLKTVKNAFFSSKYLVVLF